MSYKHDIPVTVREKGNPAGLDYAWPFKELPDMGDIVIIRGTRYRVCPREFICPLHQDGEHRVNIWVEGLS